MGKSTGSQAAGTKQSSRSSRPDESGSSKKSESASQQPNRMELDAKEVLAVLQETPDGKLHVEKAMALLGLRKQLKVNEALRKELEKLRASLPSAD
jgi:hypothetical protein